MKKNCYQEPLTEISGSAYELCAWELGVGLFCLFDLILYVPSTIFQLNRAESSLIEPILSWDKCVLLKDHNTVMPVRLEPAASRSRVKHSTTEPLRFHWGLGVGMWAWHTFLF